MLIDQRKNKEDGSLWRYTYLDASCGGKYLRRWSSVASCCLNTPHVCIGGREGGRESYAPQGVDMHTPVCSYDANAPEWRNDIISECRWPGWKANCHHSREGNNISEL